MTLKGLGRGLGSLIPARSVPISPFAGSVSPSPAARAASRDELPTGLRYVPISEIRPNPHQPREAFSHAALDELVSSIKTHGVLQPLLVTVAEDGHYELVAGERRLRAAELAGIPTVPVIVKKAKEVEKLELALIENIQRQDLNPLEEARAYDRLVNDFGMTQEEVARRVGKSRSAVGNAVRLLALPDAVKAAIRDGKISSSAARTIASFDSPDEQLRAFASTASEKLTVRDLESRLRAHKPGRHRSRNFKDPNLEAAEEELAHALGTKVSIKKRGATGRIEIAFYSEEELAALRRRLTK